MKRKLFIILASLCLFIIGAAIYIQCNRECLKGHYETSPVLIRATGEIYNEKVWICDEYK